MDAHLAVHYPAAVYFFFNRCDASLAEAVTNGLELALADGSFDRLFLDYHGSLIERSRLRQRNVISLPNPLLPAETPLERRELWYSPV